MRRGSVVAVVVALGLPHAAEPPGIVQHELRLVVSSDKSTYVVGEPIRIRLAWTNTGTEELRIPIWRGAQMGQTAARNANGEHTLLALSIYYEGKERIPYRGAIGCGPDDGWQVPPGETRDTDFEVQDTYELARPGRYVVRIAYAGFNRDNPLPPHAWEGLLLHPDIELSVRANGEK
jgi:hypothetical protein